MKERIDELEMKLTYQEELIDKLNQVIFDHQQQIDRLVRRIEKVSEQVQNQLPSSDPNEKPPHY